VTATSDFQSFIVRRQAHYTIHQTFPYRILQLLRTMVDLQEWIRTRAQRVRNPSRRTPDTETDTNKADIIERQLQGDNHKIWGWVIYRCTYSSDTDWANFMSRLDFHIKNSLRLHNGLDMMESLDYHVFEDKAMFDAANPVTVREHFRHWVKDAPQREQGVPAMRSQRYNFCIHVDEEALQSIVSGPAPPEDALGIGYVNLVCLKIWGGVRAEFETENTELDRCWMRITYQDLMPTWFNLFRTPGSWFTEYREPPQVGTP
jgi:hypothetical protein